MPENSTQEENRSSIEIEDSFLAPWGLASEELPMHILWSGSVSSIKVSYPDQLELIDSYNLDTDLKEDAETGEFVLEESDLITPGYLSFVFTDPDTHSDAVKNHQIRVRFLDEEGAIIDSFEPTTRIIRPQIRVQDAPERIKLSDEGTPDTIEIDMEYIGFGMAQISIDAQAGGEFVSEGESFHHDLLRAILETEVHKEDLDRWDDPPEEWETEAGYEVPEEEIEQIVEHMRGVAQEDNYLHDEYGAEEVLEVADALEEAESKSKTDSDVAAVIYRFIETALLSSILNVVDRHPTENVSLSSPNTKVKTKARATELEVKIKLKDNLDNVYDPEIVLIEINDNRKESGGVFETEIETNWENHQVDPDEVFSK
ncbi:hypothetical protein [Halopiger aswanensis]|uniref:hypothetical protein n=1 Tax=Halopiger aswanensis TaxID=148449 RepID=UPI0011C3F490|nr:hypothetical protein [Halopiger aswanensis]